MGKAISYARLSRRWRRMRGFRLNSGRFCVLRLRMRFSVFFRLLTRCSELVRKSFRRRVEPQYTGRSGSRKSLIRPEGRSGRLQDLRSCGRSNSFYAEAIADCLEFIKRSSLSVDGNELPAIDGL